MTIEVADLFIPSGKIYFTISSTNQKNNFNLVYKSQVCKVSNGNCRFPTFKINSNHINSENAKIRFDFYEKRADEVPRTVGETTVTLFMMQNFRNQDF